MSAYAKYKDLGETNIASARRPKPPTEKQVFDNNTMTMKQQQPQQQNIYAQQQNSQQNPYLQQSQQTVPNSNISASKAYAREMYSPPDNSMNASNNQFMENAPLAPVAAAVHIQHADHKQKLINNHRICVIDVWGSFCQPCHMIAPQYEELAKKYNRDGICVLSKEDIKLNLSNDIKGVPTFLIYKDGQEVDKVVGADLTTEEGVEAKLLKIIQSL